VYINYSVFNNFLKNQDRPSQTLIKTAFATNFKASAT